MKLLLRVLLVAMAVCSHSCPANATKPCPNERQKPATKWVAIGHIHVTGKRTVRPMGREMTFHDFNFEVLRWERGGRSGAPKSIRSTMAWCYRTDLSKPDGLWRLSSIDDYDAGRPVRYRRYERLGADDVSKVLAGRPIAPLDEDAPLSASGDPLVVPEPSTCQCRAVGAGPSGSVLWGLLVAVLVGVLIRKRRDGAVRVVS